MLFELALRPNPHAPGVAEREAEAQGGVISGPRFGIARKVSRRDRVDLERRQINILRLRSTGDVGPVSVNMQSQPLRGYKHWFDSAVSEAGLKEFHVVLPSAHLCQSVDDGRG